MGRTSEKRLFSAGLGPFCSGYDVLRILMAAVLLVAAGLKAHQLATEPVIGYTILDSRWLLMASVEFELFFGIWLLSGTLPMQTWATALACFGLFTCVSLYKALSGYATCGCFGRVEVNPWYTAKFDFAVILTLLRWRPKGQESPFASHLERLPRRAVVVLATWLFLGLPAALAMGSYNDTTLSDAGEIIGDGKIVVLEPGKWVGKRFPLLDYIDIGDKLKEGKWIVFLYNDNCPKCRGLLADVRETFEWKTRQGQSVDPLVIVRTMSTGATVFPKWCKVGNLAGQYHWLLRTPAICRMRDGVVEEDLGWHEPRQETMQLQSSG